jgi:uncharacterized protein (TIGR04562 family)
MSSPQAPETLAPALPALDFHWETLGSIIGGLSGLDVPALYVRDEAEAEDFLACYGYQWGRPGDRAVMEHCRVEALAFLEEELLRDEPGLSVPASIREQRDLRQLLLVASRQPRDLEQRWACALLRIMHTVAHSQSYFNQRFSAQIRQQILDRFTPHLHASAGGLTLGQGADAVPLADFEVKQAKSLRSIVMKLLHKAENVATDIFDRLGVRLVTKERFDALLAVRYLRSHHVIMFANVKPSRSRNTLIQMDWLREELAMLNQLVDAGRLSASERLELLRRRVALQPYPEAERRGWNHYSAIDYHSIQFTCRQMIRAREGEDEIRFFFPYEVQVMDAASFDLSRSGLASHDEYKERQRHSVKQRVLVGLLKAADRG